MNRDGRLRVAVDAAPLLGPRTGVGQLTARLLEGLAARDDLEVAGYSISRSGRDALAGVLPAGVRPAVSWLPARVAHPLWDRVAWPPLEHWTGAVDVVHAPNFVAPAARAPVVVSVHDLAFAHSPELCRPEARHLVDVVGHAVRRGAWIHTGSDFVAEEIRARFPLAAGRVRRVYSGIAAPAIAGDPVAGRARAGAERYVVAVGTVEPRKGLPGLVRAFDRLAGDDGDLALVVAGPDGWGVGEFDTAVQAATHRDRIHRLGYVADDALADVVAGASVLAYPSLYEGFGHPPLEAMSMGVPVVTTTAGSLPEVVGDAALFVEPRDDAALADALARVLSDDTLRADLRRRGDARAAEFTWSRAIADFVALYREVATA
jgi:glycosyltransferase involved in cell wall biosynthesis